jgi:hypothetical protein
VGALDNRVSRGIFRLYMEEVTGGWRKFYDQKLCDLYMPNIISDKIKEHAMVRACSMHAYMCASERERYIYIYIYIYAYTFLVGKAEGNIFLQDVSISSRIILKYIIETVSRCGLNSSGSGQGPMVGCLGSIKLC